MRNKMTSGAILLAGMAMLGIAIGTNPAQAQDHTMRSPSAVEDCLCAQQAVAHLHGRLRRERHRYDRARDLADKLARQVRDARSRVNVTDRGDIVAFKALLRRRDQANQAFLDESQRYANAVANYNNAVAHDNNMCSGRLFDPHEVEAIKQTLSCPRD